MTLPNKRNRRPTVGGLHLAFYLATAIAVLWILMVIGASFFEVAASDLPLAVIVFFSVIAFGVSALLWRIFRGGHRGASALRLHGWFRQKVDILTGPIGAKQAALQVLLIPGAAAVAFTLIALVDVAERVVH